VRSATFAKLAWPWWRRQSPLASLWSRLHAGVEPASRRIDPADVMFAGEGGHYFGVGASALRCIAIALLAAGKDPRAVHRVLDLPCGHGRVLRSLRAAFPDAALTACDLDRAAVDFCVRELSAVPVYSHADPERVELVGDFDLIWCGSLLTHLDAPRWEPFLRLLASRLAPQGVLVVTTHGRIVPLRIARGWDYGLGVDSLRRLVLDYEHRGFGFVEYPGQPGYGISIASPAWTLGRLDLHPELRVVAFAEAAWDDHQDVIAWARYPLAPPEGPT
jgi:SAM-dependent methyltransferase